MVYVPYMCTMSIIEFGEVLLDSHYDLLWVI